MAAKKTTVKPTTMRLPPDLLTRVDRQGKRQARSRTFLCLRYIADGVARDEKATAKQLGALG